MEPHPCSASLARLVVAILPDVGPALASQVARMRLVEQAQRLPVLSSVLIECHLSDAPGRVDLAARGTIWDGGRAYVAGDDPAFPVTSIAPAPVADHLRALAHDWSASETPLAEAVTGYYLEFDLDRPVAAARPPSLFVELSEKLPDLMFAAVADWCVAHAPVPSTVRLRERITSCRAALPEGGLVYTFGLMYPRSLPGIRLCTVMSMASVMEYLARIGWDGPQDIVARIVEDVAPLSALASVDLDVADAGMAPLLGLEAKYSDGPEGRALLDYLVARGLASRAQCDALAHWANHPLDAEALSVRWADLRPSSAGPRARREIRHLFKTVSHVKFCIRPDRQIAAKAYLSLAYSCLSGPAAHS